MPKLNELSNERLEELSRAVYIKRTEAMNTPRYYRLRSFKIIIDEEMISRQLPFEESINAIYKEFGIDK